MKERKLGLAKRLSAFALAFVMVFSLLATFNVSALAADDNSPTLNPGWTYDGNAQDLILVPGESDDPDYAMYYCVSDDEDYEPVAPTKSSMGDWTRNWRDDENLVKTDANDYYVWYCTFSEEENDVDVEPTLAGVVEVEKATVGVVEPIGDSRTVSTDELGANVQLLKDNTGVILKDYDEIATYKYLITETTTSSVEEGDLTQGGNNAAPMWVTATVNTAGKWRLWYQAVVENDYEDNYENSEIEHIDITITEGKKTLAIDADALKQEKPVLVDAQGVATAQSPDQLLEPAAGTFYNIYNAETGVPVSNVTVTYGKRSSDITYASPAAAEVTTANAGSTATVWFKATAEGYNDLTGTITLTIKKGVATADGTKVHYTNTANTEIKVTGDAGVATTNVANVDAKLYALASTSTSKPKATDSKWVDCSGAQGGDITSQLTDKKINYIYYMAKSNDTKTVDNSAVSYMTVYATKNATNNEWTLTELSSGTPGTWNAPKENANLSYDGTRNPLLTAVADAGTGATIQYNVKYTATLTAGKEDTTMPAASDSGWTATTLTTADVLNAKEVGSYVVWWRVHYTDNGVAKVSTPQKCNTVVIDQGTMATITAKKTDPEPTTPTWTGKAQALFEKGKIEDLPGLTWLYVTRNADNEIIGYGTTPIKATDAGVYATTAMLLDSKKNYTDSNEAFKPFTRLINGMGLEGQVVYAKVIDQDHPYFVTTIARGEPDVTEPEITSAELTYDGEAQSLLKSSGKTNIGTLYQVVTDDNNRLVSLDGTATDAGNYQVSYLVTDLDPFTLASFDMLYGWESNFRAVLEQSANVWDTIDIGNVEIKKATPIVTGVEPTSNEVTGYDLELCTYGTTDGGKIYYQAKDAKNNVIFSDAEGWRIVPEASELGEYTISYMVIGDDNYETTDWVTLDDKAQIAAGKAEVTTAPVGLGYNANGDALVLATAGEAEDGHMEYALGTMVEPVTDWSDEIPTATDEDTYYVWYKAAGDEGFADSDKDFVVATIGHETVLYRIYNPATGEHIYTYDANEVANATQNLGWTKDGEVSGTSEGTIPVYRLADLLKPGLHIYSCDQNEIDTLVATGAAKVEGVQFMTVPKGEGTVDYYRLSDPTGTLPHHYTADQNEIATLVAAGIYNLDGYIWSFPGTSN